MTIGKRGGNNGSRRSMPSTAKRRRAIRRRVAGGGGEERPRHCDEDVAYATHHPGYHSPLFYGPTKISRISVLDVS